MDFHPVDEVPVVIDGREAGQIAIDDIPVVASNLGVDVRIGRVIPVPAWPMLSQHVEFHDPPVPVAA
jgi:hypothetical protein